MWPAVFTLLFTICLLAPGACCETYGEGNVHVRVIDADGKQPVLWGEVGVELLDEQGDILTSTQFYRSPDGFFSFLSKRALGGDVLCMNAPENGRVYRVRAVVWKTVEREEIVDAQLEVGETYTPAVGPPFKVLECIRHLESTQKDGSGTAIVKWKVRKECTFAFVGETLTHVAPEETGDNPDEVTLVLPVSAVEQSVWEGMLENGGKATVDFAAAEGLATRLGAKTLKANLFVGAAVTVFFRSLDEAESLVSADTGVDLLAGAFVTIAFPGLGQAYAATMALAIVPDAMVSAIGEAKVQEVTGSDDFEGHASGTLQPGVDREGTGTVRLTNYGETLYDVRFLAKGISSGTGKEIAVEVATVADSVTPGETVEADWQVTSNHRFPISSFQGISMEYYTEPLPGMRTRHIDPIPYEEAQTGIEVTSSPEGASIEVAGEQWGVTPLSHGLPADPPEDVTLKASLEGYKTAEKTVTVEKGAINRVHFDLEKASTEPKPIQPPRGATGQLDVIICIDRSGSMADDIQAVQAAVDDMLGELFTFCGDNNISLQMGLVTYTRHTDGQGWLQASPLTSRVQEVRSSIASIQIAGMGAGSGGNEDLYGALMYGMNQPVGGSRMDMGWRDGAAKVAFVIGDEPPDDPDWEGRTLADVARVAEALDPVHVYPLLTPNQFGGMLNPVVRAMEELAGATGGQAVRVNDAKSLPGALVETVKMAVRRHRNEVWRHENPPYLLYGTMGGIAALTLILGSGILAMTVARRRAAAPSPASPPPGRWRQ